MEYVVQVIMIIVCIAIVLIIMYHFEIKLIARLLDQMYVVQPPVFPLRYDDAPPSAPQFPEHLHSLLTRS